MRCAKRMRWCVVVFVAMANISFLICHYFIDVQMLSGFKNVMFGGEGLFVTTLTGPGTVWLQGQPPQRMVSEIARRVPSGGGDRECAGRGGCGGVS